MHGCGRVDCEEEYTGESGKTFAERFREHMRAPSPIHVHHNNTCHEPFVDNFSIVGREDRNIARAIKEAILIRVKDPSLNRNIGKYQLPHIWHEVWSSHQNSNLNNCPQQQGLVIPLTPTWFHNNTMNHNDNINK